MKVIQLVLPRQPLAAEMVKPEPRPVPSTVTVESLLVKEMDEINLWTRLGSQLYFGWFTIMLTMNSAGIGVAFSSADKSTSSLWLERLIFALFAGLNILALFVNIHVRRYMIQSHCRIEVILSRLHQALGCWNMGSESRSPVPGDEVVTKIFGITRLALLLFGFCWFVLTIWPEIRRS